MTGFAAASTATKVAIGTTGAMGVAQYKQQGAIGKFNQSVAK